MSQKIRIKLKSYDYSLVDKSAEKIVKTVKAVCGYVPERMGISFITGIRKTSCVMCVPGCGTSE